MKIEQLIKKLQNYPSNTQVTFKLVINENNECQDKIIDFIGEIDTSLLYSDKPRLDIGFKHNPTTEKKYVINLTSSEYVALTGIYLANVRNELENCGDEENKQAIEDAIDIINKNLTVNE